MDPWHSGRPDVSNNRRGTGMSVPQPVRRAGVEEGRTPPGSGRFVPVDSNSINGQNILRAVQHSYIDPTYKNQLWHVQNIVAINNKHLQSEYMTRMQEMRQVQKPGTGLREKVMFTCLGCDQVLEQIADRGYDVDLSVSNFLGRHKEGVTLSLHADIQLKVAELIVTDTCWMVIFKVALGNCRLIGDIDVQEERVAVSPDYDCHQFAVGPNISQEIGVQASRNQVYCFELSSDGVPSPRPRQVLPICALKLKMVDLCDMVPAPLARELTAESTKPPAAASVYQEHRNMLTHEANQSGMLNTQPACLSTQAGAQNSPVPRSSCQYAMHSPLANNPTLQNHVAIHPGLQNQHHPVAMQSGLQNQQLPIAIQPGLHNRQHPVAIHSGLQNQQHPVAMRSGLQNQQLPVAIQPGLQNRQHPVAIHPGLQNQHHPVAMQSGLQNQQLPVAIQPGLQNRQHPVAIHSRLQNQQHPVTIDSGRQNVLNPVANHLGLQNTWYPVANRGGQQAMLSPAVNQAGAQNMRVRLTARSVLQNMQNFPAVQPAYNGTASQWPQGAGQSSGGLWCQLSDHQLGQLSGELAGQSSFQELKSLIHYGSPPAGEELEASACAASPVGLGMRLPTVIPPTQPEPVVSCPIQPIIIQPMSDVMPSFLQATPPDTEPVCASGSCEVESPIVSSMHSRVQNPALWNLFSGSEPERQNTVMPTVNENVRCHIETAAIDSWIHSTVENQALRNLPSDGEYAGQAARTSAVSVSHNVETSPVVCSMRNKANSPALWDLFSGCEEERQNTETSATVSTTVSTERLMRVITTSPKQSVFPAVSLQDTETTCAVPTHNKQTSTTTAVPTQNTEMPVVDKETTDTETTSANVVSKILGTVSEVLPGGSTLTDVRRSSQDLLIDDLDDILSTAFTGSSVDDILGSVHCDFDSGKEILPAPENDEGDAFTVGSASQVESGIEKSKEVSRIYVHEDGTVELIIERQVSSSSDDDAGGDSMPCNDTASWQRFLTDKRFQPVVLLDRLSCMPRRPASLNCSAPKIAVERTVDSEICRTSEIQNKAGHCPSDTERKGQTCSIAAKNNSKLCPSDTSHESGVNLPQRVPCRPVMKASSKPSKPSVTPQQLGLPTKCKPCDQLRNHKAKVYTESDRASKRPCKEHIRKPSEHSGVHEGAEKTHSLLLHSKSNSKTTSKHSTDAHDRSKTWKQDAKKHHKKHKCTTENSLHKRSKKSDSDQEKNKHHTNVETAKQTNNNGVMNEAASLPTISAVVRGSQQRPFSPKSVAQKLSPTAKPWRPRLWASGEMPPMLKTMATKLKHGRSHNMLATWQKSGKTTKTVTDQASVELGHMSSKNALGQKGYCVRLVAKASDHKATMRKPGEKIRHPKGCRNTDFEQQKTHRTSGAALVESARSHSVGGDINNRTASDKEHQTTVGWNHCRDVPARSWLQRSVQEPEAGCDGKRSSDTGQENGWNVWSAMGRTLGTVTADKCPEDTANGHTRGCIIKCAGLAQSPVLSADSTDSGQSAFTTMALPHVRGSDRAASVWSHKPKDPRTVHKTTSHESLASVLTEAWHRPASQHAVSSSAVSLQGKGHARQLAGTGSLKQPVDGQDTRSRHSSGQRDPPLAGQDTRSRHGSGQRDPTLARQDTLSRHGSGQRDRPLAGQDTRSRHGSGQRDPPLAGQDTRSRHGSGQTDPPLAGQDTRSRHGSGQRNPPLAGQETWSRHGSGQRDPPLAGQDTRSRHCSGQGNTLLVGLTLQCGVNAVDKAKTEHVIPWLTTTLMFDSKAADFTYRQLWEDSCVNTTDPRLRSPDERSLIRPLDEKDLHTVTLMIPLEQTSCETECSSADWGELIPVNLPQDAWNTSDFCVASSTVCSITKEYSSRLPRQRHQMMLVYSARLKKMLQQINDDEMFAENTSANISSTSSCSNTSNTHSPASRKKQLERQKLYRVLAEIKASVTADKVKIASMPLPDKEIHRRIDRSRLDCEIINEGLGQLNRFHMDQQIQVLPQILRLCSEVEKYISVEGQFLFMRIRSIPLGHCNELYALKMIIEAVYEELSLMSERGASDSRKDWLLLALGWLHMHRRKKLTEICHLDVQHVCQLPELFQQRRAWYRKMQAELQKSPRQDSAVSLLDNPLKYLARRIVTMTKYLDFIQNLSSCAHHPMGMNDTKDGVGACSRTLSQECTAQRLGGNKLAQAAVKPEPANMTRSTRDTIVKSVCLPKAETPSDLGCRIKAHGSGAEESCYDNIDIDDICLNETVAHEVGETVGEFFSDHDFIEDIGQVEDDKEDVIGDECNTSKGTCESEESGKSKESGQSEENGSKAACSDYDADIIDTESDKSKKSGPSEENVSKAACSKYDADLIDADITDVDIIDADIINAESGMSKERGQSDIAAACSESHVEGNGDDIIEAESDKSKESKEGDIVAVKETDDDTIDAENDKSKESDIVAGVGESHSPDNGNDVIDGESDKLNENDRHEEYDAKVDCCQSHVKESDGDIIDDEDDLSKESGQENTIIAASSDSHGKENNDDTNHTEIDVTLESHHEESVAVADCCESRCKESDDGQSDMPERSEGTDACHDSLVQENGNDSVISPSSGERTGHVEDIDDSENQAQQNVDEVNDADDTSGHCGNQEIEDNLAETMTSVDRGDVNETEHCATEAGCHEDESHNEENEDDVHNPECSVPQTDRHMEESCTEADTTGDSVSQVKESENGLGDSENSLYEPISDAEDIEDDVHKENDSMTICSRRSKANIVEYIYHIVKSKSESTSRQAEDRFRELGEKRKRNNGDVCTTSKHKACHTSSCADVKPIGVMLNMKAQVFSPKVMPIGVIMNGSVSHCGLAPDYSGRPCMEHMVAPVGNSAGQTERVHTPTLSAIPRGSPIPTATTGNGGTLSKAQKRKKKKAKQSHREKRLRTDNVALENDTPAAMERKLSKRIDRYDDRHLPGFAGKSLGETQLNQSCYGHDEVTDPAYYTNCMKGHHHDSNTLRKGLQGVERPLSVNDMSSTLELDKYFMSDDLHHNEASWFDEAHGVHRDLEGHGHRHHPRYRRDHKHHRHTRWHHSWKPQ